MREVLMKSEERTMVEKRASDVEATILVVDDNALDLRLASRIVEKTGAFRVLRAEDGRGAIEVLGSEPVTAILTDLQMPEMDGLSLVRRVREEHPSIPVILMTAHGSEATAVEAIRCGAASYVPKARLAADLPELLVRILSATRRTGSQKLLVQRLLRQDSHFRLDTDPELVSAVVEHIRSEAQSRDYWDPSEAMRVVIALDEALRNALYHGNLEVSSELRENGEDAFFAMVNERRRQEPYASRGIDVQIMHEPGQSTFFIKDEGPGFDTSRTMMPIEAEDLLKASGRGLLLMRAFMDDVRFNGRGNEVLLRKKHGRVEVPAASTRWCSREREQGRGSGEDQENGAQGARESSMGLAEGSKSANPSEPLALPLPGAPPQEWIDVLDEGFFLVDHERIIRQWNREVERLSGQAREGVVGRALEAVALERYDLAGVLLDPVRDPFSAAIREGIGVQEKVILRRCDGGATVCEVKAAPLRDATGSSAGFAFVLKDLSREVVAMSVHRQLRQLSRTDPLTGLLNRRGLEEELTRLLSNSEPGPYSVIVIDIDHFKRVNDTFGHPSGDLVLSNFGCLLMELCRPRDVVARVGGEEFVVLLRETPFHSALGVAERIRREVSSRVLEPDHALRITASLGVSELEEGDLPATVLQRADAALYEAKSQGRDRVLGLLVGGALVRPVP